MRTDELKHTNIYTSLFMTTRGNEETVECGEQKVGCFIIGEGGRRKRNKKTSQSYTTLSTTAIQAGRSQIVVSVLKVRMSEITLTLTAADAQWMQVGGKKVQH